MSETMNIAVILPAAGVGRRFFADDAAAQGVSSKVELDLAGKPVFLRAIELFLKRPAVTQIILAVQPDQLELFQLRWGDKLAFHGVQIVPGGTVDRWQTVLRALEAVEEACTHIAVHDAARPLASAALIDRVFDAAAHFAAVVPGVDVTATLKRVQAESVQPDKDADPLDALLGDAGRTRVEARQVMETIDRRHLVAVQTPQVFRSDLLRQAYDRIATGSLDAAAITDDAGLIEAMGRPVHVVPGEQTNLKITTPDDLELAAAIVRHREAATRQTLAKKRLFADDDDD